MRGPLQESQSDSYERPQQAWVCGLADAESPCPLGPGTWGRCPKAAACHPVLEGDRWRCNRSSHRGGPCELGPSPEGECCLVYQCTPQRSLRARRGRFVTACTLIALGTLVTILSNDWRNEVLVPGELAAQHAQLLNQHQPTKRCASCHAAGSQSFGEWLRHATDDTLAKPSQVDLCMECHREQIAPATATWAHNVEPQELLQRGEDETHIPASDRALDPTEPIVCSACHREHHGREFDLTWMSNKSCQGCHNKQTDSFATNHPEFTDWPTRRRTRIAFDHGAHELKHFPKEKQEYACSVCHELDEDGAFQKTLAHEFSCVKCHDKPIATSWEAGLPLVLLPMLDVDALQAAGHDIGQWPEEATGEFDGALPLVAKLLLASDARAAAAFEKLGPDFDFFDVDPEDTEQLAAAADVVWATKEMLFEITTVGHEAVRRRIEGFVGREVSNAELAELVAHLSPENLEAIGERWLTRLPQEMAARLPEVEIMPEARSTENLSLQDRAQAQQRVVAGGWFRDDQTLSIRYRPTGHADLCVTAWIDLLAEASTGKHAALARSLLKQRMSPTAPGLCGSCHSVDQNTDGTFAVRWIAKRPSDAAMQLSTFSHAPHITQVELADCLACHRVNTEVKVMDHYQGTAADEFVDGFHPLTKQDCAKCHTPHAAGDSCTQCHRYHVGVY